MARVRPASTGPLTAAEAAMREPLTRTHAVRRSASRSGAHSLQATGLLDPTASQPEGASHSDACTEQVGLPLWSSPPPGWTAAESA